MEIYLNFKTEAAEVIKFYEKVFDTSTTSIMTFGEMPEDPEHPVAEEAKDLILNASMIIEGTYVMFSDVPEGMGLPLVVGNNVSLVVSTDDEDKIEREFNLLAEGGNVTMPLGPTFWTKKYGMVTDKFGINWMFSYYKEDV
ncbi:VOC family protein [Enterococcus sp. BWB1-3]|uniref:VOC family protein n=1 Tax=unclassified Enterococcus TaxID=2608891 RepID=UPI0019218608|nr:MULTISPECIES: VOC family protein [unclassified Enterococcus]MBL1230458.1 VOC family protein [Enterococcus sp. BWB1-3]MCB5950837.1 VOC family protein [Enterococcus sp. BWT-B8]MCB5955277.1 VOC family protein [Enterococcus sp. CWB-B31]